MYAVYLLLACVCDYFIANQETVVELLAFFKQVMPSKSSTAQPVNSNSSSSLQSNTEHAQITTYQVCILSTNMSGAILHMNELFIKKCVLNLKFTVCKCEKRSFASQTEFTTG